MPLPLLQKLLGHSSIRTTALYWQNIYGEEEDNIGSILAGGDWLESKEPPNRKNFPELPKSPKPIFIDRKPVIPNKKPIQQGNCLLLTKLSRKVNEIQPIMPENFFTLQENSFNERNFSLTNISQESNRIETNQQLALIPNESERANEKEQILLTKIKSLEEQLKQTQNETKLLEVQNKNLTIKLAESEKEKFQEKTRADNYQQQLKTVAKTLYQWSKISYYQQLEQERNQTEAKIEQTPIPWKPNK